MPTPEYHMLREIFEQPQALADTLAQYVDADGFRPDTTAATANWLTRTADILIVASGSSRHAGLAAELMLEELSATHVDVEYASEYICRSDASLRQSGVIVVSQSGETADTLAALRKAIRGGKQTIAITNVPNSTMAREAQISIPTLAGVERAIPATKSFTTQLLTLWLLSLLAAKAKATISQSAIQDSLAQARALPALIESQLEAWRTLAESAAQHFAAADGFLYLGRGIHYSIAREGALKLKESAYVTAEGYPGGELKHGPNALVSTAMPLVMLATVDPASPESVERYEKTIQLMRDMKQQGAAILALANRADTLIPTIATQTIPIAETIEPLLAISEVIPLQLFAYFMAIHRGIDVDHPRNLVKSVTVE
jgi:glucosamine--fructose-6-phosphate aminotransferase (isomerizing)